MKTIVIFIVMLLSGIDVAEAENNAFNCLTKTIYFESRGEPIPGQFAVGSVVMNRVRNTHYPNSVCQVVHQPYQFSWTLLKGLKIRDKKAWRNAQHIAQILLLKGGLKSNVGDSLDYHSKDVKPRWAKHYVKSLTLGNHIFYLRKKSWV